jgi:positive regulator of sigma E activity
MDASREEPPENDLLTLALFVYFVALVVLVAGLLVLPALY